MTPLTANPFPTNSIGARLGLDPVLILGLMQCQTKVPDWHVTLNEQD